MKVYIRMWWVIITSWNSQKWFKNLRHTTTVHPGHIYFVSRNKWKFFVTFNDGSSLLMPLPVFVPSQFCLFSGNFACNCKLKILVVNLYLTVMRSTRQMGSGAAMETTTSYWIRCQKSAFNAASALDLAS